MRKNLGPKSVIYPEPVLVIGTYDKKNCPNAMVVAWGGLSDTNEVSLCISYTHKTAKNILLNKAFTINFATKKYEKEIDYLGMISGNKQKNKVEYCGLHTLKAKTINAPLILELPLALECSLIKYDKKTGHLFGKIKNVSIDSSIYSKGKIDLKKFQPILFDGMNNTYNLIGKKIGKAFSDYKKVK